MQKLNLKVNIRARLLTYFLFVTIIPLFFLAITSSVMISNNLSNSFTENKIVKNYPYNEENFKIRKLKIDNRSLIFKITLVAAISGISLAYLFAISITKPLSEITKAAQAIEEGDFTQRVSIKSEDELEYLGESFNNMALALQKRSELEQFRDDFVATLTHDLKVPILASVQTLEQLSKGSYGQVEEKQNYILEQLISNNKDILRMVNTILESYKYEAGKQTLYKSNVNINKVIQDCINEIYPLAQEKGHKIIFSAETENMQVNIDFQEIKRVILNLLNNAIIYTQKEGQIKLNTKYSDDELIVSVKDNGAGIAESSIESIFQRYSKGAHSLRKIGTGLGLYLSKQIIQAHNGKIWVESLRNEGSIFYFSLPIGNKGLINE